MKKLLLLAGLLFAAPALAGPLIEQPNVAPAAGPGSGTVTGFTAAEGVRLDSGTCGTGTSTTSGALSTCRNVNEQTGATYTLNDPSSDCSKLVVLNRATAITLTIPAASSFPGCEIGLLNLGVGNTTFSGSVDGVASRVMQRYQGMTIVSDGALWKTRGVSAAVGPDGLVDPDQLPIATASITGAVRIGKCMEGTGSGNKVLDLSAACRTFVIPFVIDGGGSAITTGSKGFIPVPDACTILSNELVADQSGSITLTIKKGTRSEVAAGTQASIVASAKPTLSSAVASEDPTLTGWTLPVAAKSYLEFIVDTVATVTRVTVSLYCIRTG